MMEITKTAKHDRQVRRIAARLQRAYEHLDYWLDVKRCGLIGHDFEALTESAPPIAYWRRAVALDRQALSDAVMHAIYGKTLCVPVEEDAA